MVLISDMSFDFIYLLCYLLQMHDQSLCPIAVPRDCKECKLGCTKDGDLYRCVRNFPVKSNTRLILLILLGGKRFT